MYDTVHHVMWYTVWDAKTGDLLASGTSEMCARRLGYKSANSFASAVSHGLSGSHRTYKYIFARERIDRSEADSLPPIRRKKRRACPCANTDKPKGDEFAAHHHKNNIKQEVLQVALMQIYDGLENPPKLLERRSAQTVGELVRQADTLPEKEHAQGYPRNTYIVYNNDGEIVYQRW